MPLHILAHHSKCMQSILSLALAPLKLFAFMWRHLLLGVLHMQLINAIDAARFTDGCESDPEIQDSCTIAEE